MKITDIHLPDRNMTIREWKCCHYIWEMILCPVWEGSFANFTCPKCKSKIDPPPVPMDQPDYSF